MKNKTILITGASSGLGRELVICLAKLFTDQIKLVLVARNEAHLLAVQKKIQTYNTPCLIVSGDVSQISDWQRVYKLSIEKFKKIDLLILNAGVSMWSPLAEIKDIAPLKKIMEVNYFGVVYPLYYFLSELKKTRGKVFVISSLQGYLGLPYHSGYAASKHAVHGFIEALALEEKDVSFHKVILGWVRNTNLRKNRLIDHCPNKKQINKKQKSSLFSVLVEDAAKIIVRSLSGEKENIFIPKILKWTLFFKLFFPKTSSKLIQKVVKIEFAKSDQPE